jgi:hypothetical protein
MAHRLLPEHELRWIIRQLERIARKSPQRATTKPRQSGPVSIRTLGSRFTALVDPVMGGGELYDKIVLRAIIRRLKEALPQMSDSKPRSWRSRFPYWRRMIDEEGRTLAAIMRAEQVPEKQQDSVRRAYERWRAAQSDK